MKGKDKSHRGPSAPISFWDRIHNAEQNKGMFLFKEVFFTIKLQNAGIVKKMVNSIQQFTVT